MVDLSEFNFEVFDCSDSREDVDGINTKKLYGDMQLRGNDELGECKRRLSCLHKREPGDSREDGTKGKRVDLWRRAIERRESAPHIIERGPSRRNSMIYINPLLDLSLKEDELPDLLM